MNRIEEFTELKQELEQLPAALEYTAVKAIARAKKQKEGQSSGKHLPFPSVPSLYCSYCWLICSPKQPWQ